MDEFKIIKCVIKRGEFSDIPSITLEIERNEIDIEISRVLDEYNKDDLELLQAINHYATMRLKK